MSTGAVVGIVVAVLVVAALVAAFTMARGSTGTGGLKRRFGPEYDRALARHDGDAKAARKELAGRVKRFGGLKPTPLSPADRERYETQWQDVQASFVQEPGRAVSQADRLVGDLAATRGFPPADSPEHLDALSVHHAGTVQGYRQAHALAEHTVAGGRHDTEDLRQALIGARELFLELLGDTPATAPREAPQPRGANGAEPAPGPAAATKAGTRMPEQTGSTESADRADPTESPAAGNAGEHGGRGTLGHRFAALTGAGHKDDGRGDRA
ncbi:hypothetical protein [Actinacidiphila guanduensis]|uniref:Secreted protein n=1 Tax=Actinacidiphila guanduensis TaxID=310781 RepID=A0A1G9V375_9ACTN|nr:hypothetical protein [Actinacidiphila guanduensis]SDM66569.1 hypothetical protein SAMN05216259_101109 [Actinacidiphila guanduensis]